MSDYSRFKVLRYPITKEDRTRIENMENYMGYRRIKGCGYFDIQCTEKRAYLDYVLKHSYGDECGEFGKTRALTMLEQKTFKHLFTQFFPDIDMKKVRLVDYCWYNCCEPPDYYNPEEDPFYNTLTLPTAHWIKSYEGSVEPKYVRCSLCTAEVQNDENLSSISHCPSCGSLIDTINMENFGD